MVNDLPGFLGLTSQGVIAIHANWPAYALEHGWEFALETLAQFPVDTRFCRIDHIDQCSLFVVEGFRADLDAFDDRRFHVAAWDEDLLALSEKGLISGVELLTEREEEQRSREFLRKSILEYGDPSEFPADADPLDNFYAVEGFERTLPRGPCGNSSRTG